MRNSNTMQIALIATGVLVTAFFGVFLWREVFPEYKIYQEAYVALEDFRSTYTHQPPPAFSYGVKQIVMEKADKGPPDIDRCTSCHVALEFSHFSPTKIAKDINGKTIVNEEGIPLQIPNEDYVWGRLDKEIATLLDPAENEKLTAAGESSKVKQRLKQAEQYQQLKTAHVDEHTFDMTKVLAMHPLIGQETRPFEFHPLDHYGCVSCHNGNGRALTSAKAHGPVFDGLYEPEHTGAEPKFLESDEKNDPKFASVFNHKPGEKLIFQTTPIFVGGLIEAKCVQCHQPSSSALSAAAFQAGTIFQRRNVLSNTLKNSFENETNALTTTLTLYNSVKKNGVVETIKELQASSNDYSLPTNDRDARIAQYAILKKIQENNPKNTQQAIESYLQKQLVDALGSEKLIPTLDQAVSKKQSVAKFVEENAGTELATGTIFQKWDTVQYSQDLATHLELAQQSIQESVKDAKITEALSSDIDNLLKTYSKGQNLFFSQGCYACHRISGMARGGVGPELTYEGLAYPWFIKESIVWPQADVKTSTMPNFHLDHEELESLVTFLLGQTGQSKSVSDTAYKIAIKEWEAGKKSELEQPVSPEKIQDVRYGMTIFATEGCASCHRLLGYESNVGFSVEKDKKVDFNTLYNEKSWFHTLIPETIGAKQLVQALEKNSIELDKRISNNVRKNSLLEEIESSHPGLIEALYPAFKYAARARNDDFSNQGPEGEKQLQDWKDRIHRVLMIYVQEYGLGRVIGPRPNWSGVYRSDSWLMEHFRNPSAYSPKSIMPAFPFDDTKFYTLTNMLDVIGRKNRNAVNDIWKARGFNPEQAYEIYCSQCHGPYRLGNGPVAEWIYPIPKNLRNPDFMRNLTPGRVRESIHFGILGTPMPPWGVAASDKLGYDKIPVLNEEQIGYLTDWLFSQFPGGTVIRTESDTPKWEYKASDVIKELKREGGEKKIAPKKSLSFKPKLDVNTLTASLKPTVVAPKNQDDGDVSKYFDITTNEKGKVDTENYFIKKEYYTPDNLTAGRNFFELNCAVCHGREGDGSGNRAEAMYEAKPRMLINLNWLHTRDDLRLLRSIKYGVSGTSMTPWGDQTTSLQRMQLVMFIRSLSEQSDLREQLLDSLYDNYDKSVQTLDLARNQSSQAIATAKNQYRQAQEKRTEADQKAAAGKITPDEAANFYKQELTSLAFLKKQEASNKFYDELRLNTQKQKELMMSLGSSIINNTDTISLLPVLLTALNKGNNAFVLKDNKFIIQATDGKERNETVKQLLADLNKLIDNADQEIQKSKNTADQAKLKELEAKKLNLLKTRNKVISTFEEIYRLEQSQLNVYKNLSSNKAEAP